jgi:hypothetical protein
VNISIEEIQSQINTATENNTVAVFYDMFNNVPSWQDFIDHMNFAYFNPPIQVQNDPNQIVVNGVSILNNFYIRNRIHSNDIYLKEHKEILSTFDKVFNFNGDLTAAYINFVGNIHDVNIHSDERDMIYWQCIGSSEWKVYLDKEDQSPRSYILNPGDVLVSPAETLHSVIADMPRAALVFAYK